MKGGSRSNEIKEKRVLEEKRTRLPENQAELKP